MPQFQVSLRDSDNNLTVDSSNDGTTIIVTDSSNYSSVDEDGYEFEGSGSVGTGYREVEMIKPSLEVVTNISVIKSLDGTWYLNDEILLNNDEPDGVYDIKLTVVPEYETTANYQSGDDIVYYQGNFYRCIQNDPSGQNNILYDSYWEFIEKTSLTSKYTVSEKFVLQANLVSCYVDAVFKAVEEIVDSKNERYDERRNKFTKKSNELIVLLEAIEIDTENQNWTRIQSILDYTNSNCNCDE